MNGSGDSGTCSHTLTYPITERDAKAASRGNTGERGGSEAGRTAGRFSLSAMQKVGRGEAPPLLANIE